MTVHVKNTGRCRELLVPGATVYLEQVSNPERRKTAYDLIAVEKGSLLINMDSQAPNQIFYEWAEIGGFLPEVVDIKREYSYGTSRLDFCLKTFLGIQHLVEVKGVTLESNGEARFPDAPTKRGLRHIRELQQAAKSGMDASLVFIVQMHGPTHVVPNQETQPEFGTALREAADSGVQIYAYDCIVTPDSISIRGILPVRF